VTEFGDGVDRSTVCITGVEELVADETPADRDDVRVADTVGNAEHYARLATVYRRHGNRYFDALSAVRRRPPADGSPAAADALSRHTCATGPA